jgi:hypothetical protein
MMCILLPRGHFISKRMCIMRAECLLPHVALRSEEFSTCLISKSGPYNTQTTAETSSIRNNDCYVLFIFEAMK